MWLCNKRNVHKFSQDDLQLWFVFNSGFERNFKFQFQQFLFAFFAHGHHRYNFQIRGYVTLSVPEAVNEQN